jgi:hypothetical protein
MQKFNLQELNLIKDLAQNRKVKNEMFLSDANFLITDHEHTKLLIYSENRVIENLLNKVEKYINID